MPMPGLAAVFLSGRGCARRSELVEAGFTPHAISSMVRSGEIERVRIGWYVPRGADPMLRQAVRVGAPGAALTFAAALGASLGMVAALAVMLRRSWWLGLAAACVAAVALSFVAVGTLAAIQA